MSAGEPEAAVGSDDMDSDGWRVGSQLVEGRLDVGFAPALVIAENASIMNPVNDERVDGCKLVEQLTVEELAQAETLSIPTDVHP